MNKQLSDYTDDELMQELTRRGYYGALRYTPALLEALANLVDMHDEEPSMLTTEDWDNARKAIAKARNVNS